MAVLVFCMWLSPVQAAPIQIGDTGIVRLGMYHYHNQEIAPRPSVPSSPKTYTESSYQDEYAKKLGGKTEVTTPDGTRCDIPADTHAIEVDFADK